MRNKIVKLKIKQNKNPKTNIILSEISFSGLGNITLEKEFVLTVVDLEVLEILKSRQHTMYVQCHSIPQHSINMVKWKRKYMR